MSNDKIALKKLTMALANGYTHPEPETDTAFATILFGNWNQGSATTLV